MNKVFLVGNLTEAPKVVYHGQGENRIAVCNFTLATHRKSRNADGSAKVDFIKCSCFRATAENLAKHMVKGGTLAVEGELNNTRWEKDGVKQYSYQISCNTVKFMGNPKQKTAAPAAENQPAQAAPIQEPVAAAISEEEYAEYHDVNDQGVPF